MMTTEVSQTQIEQFVRDGAVTLDGPYSDAQIAAAAEVFDRLMPGPMPIEARKPMARDVRANDAFDPALLAIIAHPFLEDVARAALQAEHVTFHSVFLNFAYATPGKAFDFFQHVDVKYRLSDLDAVPRRMLASFMVWLTDVTMDCAPFMYRPGSHRLIAGHMEAHPAYVDDPANMDQLPPLPFAEVAPLLVKAGQVTLNTSSLVHGGSVNTGRRDRKVMFIHFHPRHVPIRANMVIDKQRQDYLRRLRDVLPPDRRSILPD